jgi:hypothetical protein
MADAIAAAFRLPGFIGLTLARPSSTRRRIASERDGAPLRAAHLSIDVESVGGSRMAETGSCPVAGRPRFFRATRFAGLIFYLYYKKPSRARGIGCFTDFSSAIRLGRRAEARSILSLRGSGATDLPPGRPSATWGKIAGYRRPIHYAPGEE